ncbi:ATRX chromatin remodeler, like [Chanos chanos]|uniref:ATP-dependent helicase ATRX n=1 Tax=Chanos chanos TaxID=29144 RepID=A0A6J2WVD9_CHACN|nr:transcriptional regulator ATRX-like [Chanos chanos]
MSTEVLSPECGGGGSGGKLDALVGKLHEYLAVSTQEGSVFSQPGHWSGEMAKDFIKQQTSAGAVEEASRPSENRKSHSSCSRRKPSVVIRHTGLDESNASSESTTEDAASNNSYSDPDLTSLPKGTVVVRPEPVSSEVRDDFRGPEFRSKRAGKPHREFSDRRRGFELERVNCTACGQQVNHFQKDSVFQHPVLKVLICKSCFRYYMSDDISKDSEGMDEQCRWCAEGGNLIGCDYCSNAFCKKCVLRNLGRKELSAIMDEDRKWYCYVCSPEPLLDLVLACDSVLQNLEQLWARKRPRHDSDRPGPFRGAGGARGRARGRGYGGTTSLATSSLSHRMQHLVDMTTTLSRSFVTFMQSGGEEEGEEEEDETLRVNWLQGFRNVLEDLRRAHDALQDALDSQVVGGKHSQVGGGGCDMDAQRPRGRGRPRVKFRAAQPTGVMKELVVKLTPVTMTTELSAVKNAAVGEDEQQAVLKRGDNQPLNKNQTEKQEEEKNEADQGREEEMDGVDEEEEGDEVSICPLSEESKRSPRVKTTPRRRPDDWQSQSDEHLAECPAPGPAQRVAVDRTVLVEDSDSDEMPAILRQTAAMATTEGEDGVDSDEDQDTSAVRKQHLFGLMKTTPPSQDRANRKRKLTERTSSTSSSSSSSTGTQDSKRRLRGRPRKVARTDARSDTSSCDTGDTDSDDQKIKPLTEGISLLGSGTFQQSSGDEGDGRPSLSLALEDDDPENRIAKQILLTQIRANHSSCEDSSSDGESESETAQRAESEVSQRTDRETEGSETDESREEEGGLNQDHEHKMILFNIVKSTALPLTAQTVKLNLQSPDTVTLCYVTRSPSQTLPQKALRTLSSRDHPVPEQMESSMSRYMSQEGLSKGRRQIRAILEESQLAAETQQALREEEERRKRLAQREEEERRERDAHSDPEVQLISVSKGPAPLILEHQKDTHVPLVEVHPHLVSKLKLHQREGVRFMWNCCCESVQKVKTSVGSGCILAHCMGLGKTLQVVTFLHTVLLCEKLGFKTALVLCPLNTVLNWLSEFHKWQQGMRGPTLMVMVLDRGKVTGGRAKTLALWQRSGGVIIMGYEMFRNLTHGNSKKSQTHRDTFRAALLNPGPDFVVCDEGHVLKNEMSVISQAMSTIRTRRRIILTGTPLQNNLSEYHCMVNFIKENLLGSLREFRNRFMNPIQNGQCADSTPADVQLMKNRAHVLHSLLAGCVQRRDYSVLTQFLPPKHEYVLAVRMTPLQCQLYTHYLKNYTGQCGVRSLFQDVQLLSQIWTHPWCLQLAYRNKEGGRDNPARVTKDMRKYFVKDEKKREEGADADKAEGRDNSVRDVERTEESSTAHPTEEVREDVGSALQGPRPGWYQEFVSASDATVLEHSGKMVLLFEILRCAEELQEKVLVFSQSLVSLDLIEEFLQYVNDAKKRNQPSSYKGRLSWERHVDYYRLDGSTTALARKNSAQKFNNNQNKRGRLFLISTRAGSLGINLVAANRVVLFDASWNPSHDIQSIFRVYRFGQIRPVFVYRLLAQGTMEQKIYERQVAKQSLSSRVLDEQQIERHFTHSQLSDLYRFHPEPASDHTANTTTLLQDSILAALLEKCGSYIVSYHEHDSLLDHKEDEELSEEERRAAWAEYHAEKNQTYQHSSLSKYSLASLCRKTNEELEMLLMQNRQGLKDLLQRIIPSFSLEQHVENLMKANPGLTRDKALPMAVSCLKNAEKEQRSREELYQQKLNEQQTLIVNVQKILSSRKSCASHGTQPIAITQPTNHKPPTAADPRTVTSPPSSTPKAHRDVFVIDLL